MALDEDFILDLLINSRVITDAQAKEAKRIAHDKGKKLQDILEELKYAKEDDVIQSLANEYGMETFDLSEYRIPDEVVKLLNPDQARRYKIVPIMKHDNTLTVAMADPTCLDTLDTLRFMLKMDIDAMISRSKDIDKALVRFYGTADDAADAYASDLTNMDGLSEQDLGIMKEELAEEEADAPIIRLVSLILIEAYRSRASDIHMEPMEKRFRIRYRVDGALHEVESPPKYLQNNIVSRVKIMAKLDIAERRVPQDGRIMFSMPGKQIDLRVSTVPTVHGESIVMRILDKSSISLGIPELGMLSDDQTLIEKIISMPDGIFLVTGPTGSGKTTSLYAFLNTLNKPNRKIITAEDPVEYELSGINQVQCDNSIGMTYARALRAMLRQAPNIVMVGEIRDIETGAIAINAALTGHLVFSTLHTNDAPTAVTRLVDMGVKPFLIASGLRAVMAQRLVRRNCKVCTKPTKATDEELRLLEYPANHFDGANLKKGSGCPECKGGYRGRMGIYEIFMIEKTLVQMILTSQPVEFIRKRAIELGMRSLREDGIRKASNGITTLEEVIRSTRAEVE